MKRTAFYLSDGTGITAETLGHSMLSQFGDIELSEGLVMNFADAANAELPGVISAIDDEMVDVDFNHPLAGRTLGFKVEIIDVQPHSGEDEVQHAG